MLDLTFHEFLKIIGKKWWIIALITLAATGFAGYINYFKLTPIYSNYSTLLVNEQKDTQNKSSITFDDVMLYQKLMGTYKDIIRSKRILNIVSEQTDPKLTPEQISGMLAVTDQTESQVIRITVTNPDYAVATDLANKIAEAFSSNLQTIMTVNNVQILDSAELKPYAEPLKPRKKLNMAMTFMLSAFASVLLILLLHLLDTRIKVEEDLSGALSGQFLGSIPEYKKTSKSFLISKLSPDSLISEAFRSIRTSIKYVSMEHGHQVILFTSSLAGDGKTSFISNLGILSAQDGKRTLLIDGDLRQPHLHHVFNCANRNGLSSVLSGYADLEEAIIQTDIPGLSLLTAGPVKPSPAELLGSARMKDIIRKAKENYDFIYIDSPAVWPITDAKVIAQSVDSVVIIIRAMHTKKEHIKRAQKMIEPFKDKVIGLIMNGKRDDG